MIDHARGRRLILVSAAIGLVARIAFGLFYWVDKPLTHDEREYLALAESVAAGRGFVYDTPEGGASSVAQFGRAPAYPLFLAAIGAGGGHSSVPARVKIAQALLGAVTVWLIGVIAARAAGPGAGAAAAAIAAVYPPLVWITSYVLSETLYSVLALGAVVWLDAGVDPAGVAHDGGRRARVLAGLAGLATGAAVLTRPAMLFFLPLAALWLLRGRRVGIAALLVAGTLIVVLPWTARNARVYGRFVLVASEGGITFWTGNHPLARGEGDLAANPEIKRADLAFRREHPGLSEEALEPLYYRAALHYIAAHPVWWAGLLVRKAFYTIVPVGPSYALHSTKYVAASMVSYALVLLLALPGLRALAGSRTPPTALFALAGSALAVCVLFFPQERFRIPVIDPTLTVCAGATCARRLNL